MKYEDLIEGDELAHSIHWAKVYIATQTARVRAKIYRWVPASMPADWDGKE
jgi:hypothetical protein